MWANSDIFIIKMAITFLIMKSHTYVVIAAYSERLRFEM